MYNPSLDEVRRLTAQGKRVPIYREILADMETPVSAYRKVAHGEYSFLLESLAGGENLARYSFLGSEPYRVLKLADGEVEITSSERTIRQPFSDPLHSLRWELEEFRTESAPSLPRFHGGAVGYFGYELTRYFSNLVPPSSDPLGLPEALLMLMDTLLVFDHLEHKIKVVSHVWPFGDVSSAYAVAAEKIDSLIDRLTGRDLHESYGAQRQPPETLLQSSAGRSEFINRIQEVKRHVTEGDVIRAHLTERFSRPLQCDPFNVYRALRTISPAPYMYYLRFGDAHIAGASPDMLLRLENGVVTSRVLAEPVRRGRDAADDAAAAEAVRASASARAKNTLLVDLARNDIGRISAPDSLAVPRFMEVERYARTMHLASEVTGRLRADLSQYDALRACFPAGSVSGAPKLRAMELIASLEGERRGPLGGAVGYFDYSGNADMTVAVRTVVVKDGTAHLRAGTSIGAESDPEEEYQACLDEAREMAKALEIAETM